MAEALDPALPPELDRLAQAVLRRACDRQLKLVAAESCTGGLLASLLTDVPGMSHAFERGFVTYTNEAKHELLGVPLAVLDGPGAVSKACAMAMAEGALAHSRGDIAASVTGYTEGGPDQPAGLVHFGCAAKGRPTTHRVMLYGDIGRAGVRIRALETALGLIMDQMLQSPSADAA
ncbi:MAG: cinA [Phenylobacterium sp.]|nr:cinA [Phenylobacterium sp.]